jgi:Transposase
VADHIHVIQHVGKAVKKVIGRCTRSAAGKQTLDSQLHLFLRNQEDLSAEEEQARASLEPIPIGNTSVVTCSRT